MRLAPRQSLLAVALAAAATSGCVKDMRYRYFPEQPCGSPGCVNLPAREKRLGWELSYIEFKDDGTAYDALQATRAVELIRQAKADNGGAAVVMLYVHGWKHNANAATPPAQKDVEKFKTALDRVATMLPPPVAGRLPALVGIYIGWRGGTVNVQPVKTLTYWSRRAVARRVGRSALFETVDRIVDAAKPGGSDDVTKLILVGHSFGARVLENAVDGMDARGAKPGRMLAWQRQLSAGAAFLHPPADLVVFVNAATQSSISETTVKRLEESNYALYSQGVDPASCADDPKGDRRPECRSLPLYVAVSSVGDTATRYVLPIANTVIPPGPLPLRLRAAAFSGGLQSHSVVEVDCPPPAPYRCDPQGDREFCFEASRDDTRVCYEVRRKPGARNRTPFWIMTVDTTVVRDHGDIWNQNLLDLFGAILERSRAADVSAMRVSARQTLR